MVDNHNHGRRGREPADGARAEQRPGRTPVNRRRFLATVGASTGLLGLAGCTGSDGGDGGGEPETVVKTRVEERTVVKTVVGEADTPTPETETVRMAFVPSSATAPIWVAQEHGFFEERGIELRPTTAVSGAKATAQLATGQLDITIGAVGASTFNAIADGVPISLAADEAGATPGLPVGNRYYIREGLYEDGMTMDDVEPPVTVALNVTAAVSEYMLARTLAIHDNLSWDDVEVKTMPFPQMISAMGSGAIDLAQQIDPLGPIMAENVGAKFLEYSNRPTPELQVAGIIIGGPFKNQRRAVARKWLEAYVLGIRKYYELGGLPSDGVAPLVAEALENPEESIRTAVPYFHNKNGRLWTDDILTHQEFLACQGYVQEQVSGDQIFSEGLLEEALDEIGRVPESEERVGEDVFNAWRETSPADWPDLGGHKIPDPFPNDAVCGNPP